MSENVIIPLAVSKKFILICNTYVIIFCKQILSNMIRVYFRFR